MEHARPAMEIPVRFETEPKRYVHWRLETYGVFYPEGKTNWSALRSLLRQFPNYNHWLGEMDALRRRKASYSEFDRR